MTKTLTFLACVFAAACGTTDTDEAPVTQTGLQLRTDILADTDVAGMSYTITPVDCETGAPNDPEGVLTVVRDLEDILLPGGNPGLAGQPFDASSQHLFADAFQAVPAGCYDVLTQPIDADGEASEDCAPASASNVAVAAGEVTEITLINQCEGEDPIGGLDVISALNHPPVLVGAHYDPSKFTCQDSTTLCVVASDPDSDPLALTVTGADDLVFNVLPAEINADGQTVLCVTVDVPGPGEHAVTLTVHDQMHAEDGTLVSIESQLAEGLTSSSSITMPIHAMAAEACICECPEGFELNDAGDACEQFLEGEPIENGNTLDVCEGDDRDEYGAWGARFPDGGEILNPFFGQSFDEPSGRLNAVGIWSCQDVGDEWIGFTTCVTVEADGEYVIGTAGDDQSRILIDGQLVFAQAGQASFRRWWMVPVALSAGVHVIEMQGRDSGGVSATLGAEIYGPFPSGSTANDGAMMALDYENSIVWSTSEQLGGVFNTGETTGYTCPDGTSLNLCGEAPTCTGFQEVECVE